MDTPKLPSNPSTISDLRPRANKWTPESVRLKYAGKPLDGDVVTQIHRDLEELAAWDNYERRTSETREATKFALRRLLAPHKIDLSLPLVDTDGREHRLVYVGPREFVTERSGLLFVWGLESLNCRTVGESASLRIGNAKNLPSKRHEPPLHP